jgi:hypothetical protein
MSISLWPLVKLIRHINGAMVVKVGVMHMIMKAWCTCSCGMVLMMHVSMIRSPMDWVTILELRRSICVASRILTTKIPSALLVVIIWLQHTWCPRFCRGTFGYGTKTPPIIRRIEEEYWNLPCVCMLVHPRLPNAHAMQMHTQKVTFVFIQNVVSKTRKNKFMIERSK